MSFLLDEDYESENIARETSPEGLSLEAEGGRNTHRCPHQRLEELHVGVRHPRMADALSARIIELEVEYVSIALDTWIQAVLLLNVLDCTIRTPTHDL